MKIPESFSIVLPEPGRETTQSLEAIARYEATGHVTYIVVCGLALPMTTEASQRFAALK